VFSGHVCCVNRILHSCLKVSSLLILSTSSHSGKHILHILFLLISTTWFVNLKKLVIHDYTNNGTGILESFNSFWCFINIFLTQQITSLYHRILMSNEKCLCIIAAKSDESCLLWPAWLAAVVYERFHYSWNIIIFELMWGNMQYRYLS